MSRLLRIDVSPRSDASISRKMGDKFVAEWQKKHSDGSVTERDLNETHLPFTDMPWIVGSKTEPSTHDEKSKNAIAIGNALIAELKAHDEYVLCMPVYNFNLPAKMKAYLDHVVRGGETFKMNADQSVTGLLTGKKLTVLIAGAGEYEAGGAAEKLNFFSPYLTFIWGWVGVKDVKFVYAGSTWKVDSKMVPLDTYLEALLPKVAAAVE